MQVVLASNNPGKIRELQAALLPLDYKLISQAASGVGEIAETGLTFVENALIKARHVCQEAKLPAIADDSGLVVPSLQGQPGIYSARYAGPNASAQDNIKKLLCELQHTPDHQRDAYFYCVLVYLKHADDPMPVICQGIWHGKILTAPQGVDGFGYDPIFYVSGENKSAAELSIATKNQISHRGQAMQGLIKLLESSQLKELP